MDRTNILKIVILLKGIYRFDGIFIKILMTLFTGKKKQNKTQIQLRFIGKQTRKTLASQITVSRKGNAGNFKTAIK